MCWQDSIHLCPVVAILDLKSTGILAGPSVFLSWWLSFHLQTICRHTICDTLNRHQPNKYSTAATAFKIGTVFKMAATGMGKCIINKLEILDSLMYLQYVHLPWKQLVCYSVLLMYPLRTLCCQRHDLYCIGYINCIVLVFYYTLLCVKVFSKHLNYWCSNSNQGRKVVGRPLVFLNHG